MKGVDRFGVQLGDDILGKEAAVLDPQEKACVVPLSREGCGNTDPDLILIQTVLDAVFHKGQDAQRETGNQHGLLRHIEFQPDLAVQTAAQLHIAADGVQLFPDSDQSVDVLEGIAKILRKRNRNGLDLVIRMDLGQEVDGFQAVQVEVRADLHLQILHLRLHGLSLMAHGFLFGVPNRIQHGVEPGIKLIDLHDIAVLPDPEAAVARGDLLKSVGNQQQRGEQDFLDVSEQDKYKDKEEKQRKDRNQLKKIDAGEFHPRRYRIGERQRVLLGNGCDDGAADGSFFRRIEQRITGSASAKVAVILRVRGPDEDRKRTVALTDRVAEQKTLVCGNREELLRPVLLGDDPFGLGDQILILPRGAEAKAKAAVQLTII